MARGRKRSPGLQNHAEGQHGEKTHQRFVEQLHETTQPVDQVSSSTTEGHHRLQQDREQHDEAERNSEQVEVMRQADDAR